MKVKFWGVRGSIATPGPETDRYGGNTPCVTVEHAGTRLLLDAGTGIRKLGLALAAEAGGKPLEVHLLISHCHWDHIQGFPFFAPAFVPGNVIHVYGMSPTEKPLQKVLAGQMDPEYFPVALGDLAARLVVHELRDEFLEIGPFAISHGFLNHPGITLGYRIEAGGRVLAYATDTEPFRRLLASHKPAAGIGETYGIARDQEIVRLAREADLYIADSQYTPEEYEAKRGWGHSSYLDAVHLALEAEAKRLALFSHDPMHDDEAVDKKVLDARRLAQIEGSRIEIFAAAEGMEIDLAADEPVEKSDFAETPWPVSRGYEYRAYLKLKK